MPEPAPDRSPAKRALPRRVIGVGAGIAGVGALMLASPLVLGRAGPVKYIMMFGFLACCCGLGMVLNGFIDWMRKQ